MRQKLGLGDANSNAVLALPSSSILEETTTDSCVSFVKRFRKVTCCPDGKSVANCRSAPCAFNTAVFVCSEKGVLGTSSPSTMIGMARTSRWLRRRLVWVEGGGESIGSATKSHLARCLLDVHQEPTTAGTPCRQVPSGYSKVKCEAHREGGGGGSSSCSERIHSQIPGWPGELREADSSCRWHLPGTCFSCAFFSQNVWSAGSKNCSVVAPCSYATH